MKEILIVGAIATFVFLCIVVAIRKFSLSRFLPPYQPLTPRRAAERTPLR